MDKIVRDKRSHEVISNFAFILLKIACHHAFIVRWFAELHLLMRACFPTANCHGPCVCEASDASLSFLGASRALGLSKYGKFVGDLHTVLHRHIGLFNGFTSRLCSPLSSRVGPH